MDLATVDVMLLSSDVYCGTLDAQDTLSVESIVTSGRCQAHKTQSTTKRNAGCTPILTEI